jgi:thioredoxin-like negative regulator of GroEL
MMMSGPAANLVPTPETPEQLLEGQMCLIEFFAAWCPYSLLLKRKMEKIGQLYGGRVTVGRIDAEAHPEIADALQVEYIPAILVLREGKVAQRWYGDTPVRSICEAVDECLRDR